MREAPKISEDLLHNDDGALRDDHLFEIPPQHAEDPLAKILIIEFMGPEKPGTQIIKTVDRSLQDRGKIGREQSQTQDIPLGGIFSAIDIDQIAHGLESVEGKTQRDQKVHLRKVP